ncbi:hypothetical protein P7C70_g4483, partial [Phenoliferia sp. Uapishka_3]
MLFVCPYQAVSRVNVVNNHSIDEVSVYPYYDSPFGRSSETSILLARRIQRIWCARCRLPPTLALPPEILLRVIHYLLPEPSHLPFDKRSAILRDLCLVNRTWQAVAQPELFIHPVLAWWGQERRFLTTLEERVELGEMTKVLRVGDARGGRSVPAPPFKLGRLLELCPTLREFHLAQMSSVSSPDFLKAEILRELWCSNLSFSSSHITSFPTLSYLRQLSFYNCDLSSLPSNFLSPTTLPSLRTLALRHLTDPCSTSILSLILPQLTSLSTDSQHRLALSPFISTATSLRLISVTGDTAADLVGHLTIPLQYLHIPRWQERQPPGTHLNLDQEPLVTLIKECEEKGTLNTKTTLVICQGFRKHNAIEDVCHKRGIGLRSERELFGDGGEEMSRFAEIRKKCGDDGQVTFWKLVEQLDGEELV